ncbi:MAG: hypothetical protein ABFE08_06050 [Armatimonadia bacterium]
MLRLELIGAASHKHGVTNAWLMPYYKGYFSREATDTPQPKQAADHGAGHLPRQQGPAVIRRRG